VQEPLGHYIIEDRGFDLGGDTVGMRPSGPASFVHESGDAADLERAPDLVEGVAVIAHELAGLGDIAEFIGESEQRQLALGTV
jgi:hypothetical protein